MGIPIRDKIQQYTAAGPIRVITAHSGPYRGHCLVQ